MSTKTKSGSRASLSCMRDVRPKKYRNTISLTFGDRAENHAGMQMIGKEAHCGFCLRDLQKARDAFQALGCGTELVSLHEEIKEADEAYVLVIRGGVSALLHKDPQELFEEQLRLDVDTKAFMKGRVVNKKARYNLCYGASSQEPDYANKKGRIVAFDDVPLLNTLRKQLSTVLGEKANDLVCELNLYYNLAKCGIGFHGDTERRIVICARLGASIPLQYRWFCRSTPVGEPMTLTLHHGDMYVMSEKAVGFDWKRSSRLTLRHAAGASKFMKVKRSPVPANHAPLLLKGNTHASTPNRTNKRSKSTHQRTCAQDMRNAKRPRTHK